MSRRIQYLNESPCNQCGCDIECDEKIKGNFSFLNIKDVVFGNADFDYHDCPLWIALNAPEMIEVEDE